MNLSTDQVEQIRSLYMERTKLHQIVAITGITLWAVQTVIYDQNHRLNRPHNPNPRKRSIPVVKRTPMIRPKPATRPVELSHIQIRILVLTNFGYDPKEIAGDLKIQPQEVRKQIKFLSRAKKIEKRV